MNNIIRNILQQTGYPLNKTGLYKYLKTKMPFLLSQKFAPGQYKRLAWNRINQILFS